MIMKVGDYVKVVNAIDMPLKDVGDIVKVTEVDVPYGVIRFRGSYSFWLIERFEPLPILTEAPPKGSKVVKVEKSGIGRISDDHLGKVFTSMGNSSYSDSMLLDSLETGGFDSVNLNEGKWDLVSLPEDNDQVVPKPEYREGKQYRCLSWHGDFFNKGGIYEYYSKNKLVGEGGIPHFVGCSLSSNFEEVANTEAQHKMGEYLKVIKGVDDLPIGDLVQYVRDEKDGYIRVESNGPRVIPKDCIEKLPILTEPVPIGSKVVKIKRNRNNPDNYIGDILTTCESLCGSLKHRQWVVLPNGKHQCIWGSLSDWALVEAKVETEFQVGDRVIAKEKATTETREFQGEYLNIDQLLAKCHTLAAKKSFVSKIFKKGYWV